MNKQRFVRKLVTSAVLAALGASGMALAAPEMEPNQPMSAGNPQLVFADDGTGKGTATVEGSINHVNNLADVDFYRFKAKAGDFVTIDIDATGPMLDAKITLYGPLGGMPLAENDLPGTPMLDPGSFSYDDPLLSNFAILEDGEYTVAVHQGWTSLGANGTYGDGEAGIVDYFGPYTLIVSGVSAPESDATHMAIHVKPGNVGRTKINPTAKETIPVVLLSSDQFNAMNVDASTVTFGRTGAEPSLKHCPKDGAQDFNKDGRLDQMCLFENHLSGFQYGDLEAFIKGKMKDGKSFEGRGWLKAKWDKADKPAERSNRAERSEKGQRRAAR